MMVRRWGKVVASGAALGSLMVFAPSAHAQEHVSTVEVTQERGTALSCHGTSGGRSVAVSLYGNSAFGNFASVAVEGPGSQAPLYTGDAQPDRLFGDHTVNAVIPLTRSSVGGPAGRAVVVGTLRAAARPTDVHETLQDGGYLIETTGTRQELAATVRAVLLGQAVPLTCADSFRFDLEVRRTLVQPTAHTR
ncbi:hypothetical protein OHA09_35145 [Streptomyces longwoodensis]|uniref:hypothetical protein n=1 Tax=Streptomyces longwoodensis TaxID=68231 RepID=UPI002E81D5B9|nr:hypothetical protein [Streptomyces longwoodensis]WUC61966.1 hypothetical protein OHA09_35145 [Streptomyces longwoodensis]